MYNIASISNWMNWVQRRMAKLPYKVILLNGSTFLFPLLLYWLILFSKIPTSYSRYLHSYSLPIFLGVVILYYISFSLPGRTGKLAPLGLTMTLVAVSLSYIWSSGFSDNFIIGGLLPYKDGRNYYYGANLLLNGLPMIKSGQATERPLFPSFLATILFLTGQNLKVTMGIITQFVGLGIYYSSRQIRYFFGAVASSVFATLLYFYILPFFGYTMSEQLGFLAGCFGFAMISLASQKRSGIDLLLGVVVLLVGISARAGAFFIFPLLALWAGWISREDKRYSFRSAVYAFALFIVLYILVNSIYARLVGIPSGSSFGNFSYAIYGQIRGGIGWHSAIEELGTRDPNVVYHAAFDYFLQHPTHLLIGFAKSYRDLLQMGGESIFPMPDVRDWQYIPNLALWLAMLLSMAGGIVYSIKGIGSSIPSLLLAGFVGVFLSIPFLPPEDGGARFHAATVPFFFAPLVIGILYIPKAGLLYSDLDMEDPRDLTHLRFASTTLVGMIMVMPLLIYHLSDKPALPESTIDCSVSQLPFAIRINPMSSIDLIVDGTSDCGYGSRVCLDDFQRNNLELVTDDFYQWMIASANEDQSNVRLFSSMDLLDNKFYYFYVPLKTFPALGSDGLIMGCANRIKTKNQIIYKVESVLSAQSR